MYSDIFGCHLKSPNLHVSPPPAWMSKRRNLIHFTPQQAHEFIYTLHPLVSTKMPAFQETVAWRKGDIIHLQQWCIPHRGCHPSAFIHENQIQGRRPKQNLGGGDDEDDEVEVELKLLWRWRPPWPNLPFADACQLWCSTMPGTCSSIPNSRYFPATFSSRCAVVCAFCKSLLCTHQGFSQGLVFLFSDFLEQGRQNQVSVFE